MSLCCKTPVDEGLDYGDITLNTRDGVKIRGWYIPSQNRATVILLHSMAANRLGTMDQALMFVRNGYGVLMIDLRVHGESGGDEYLDRSAGV